MVSFAPASRCDFSYASFLKVHTRGIFGLCRLTFAHVREIRQLTTMTRLEYSTATRPDQASDYASFTPHPPYASEYVGAQAQVPSRLPQSTALNLLPPAHQPYGTHDPAYYNQSQTQYPAYLESEARQLPEIISIAPAQGRQGTEITIWFKSIYNLDNPPTSIVTMFGHKRCDSVLTKSPSGNSPYTYSLSSYSPAHIETGSPSPRVPLFLAFEGSETSWQSPTLEISGGFTYLDQYPVESPKQSSRKRKLTPETAERRSPPKKASYSQLPPTTQSYYASAPPTAMPSADFARSSISDEYSQSRRFRVPEITYGQSLPRVQTQNQYYQPPAASAATRLHSAHNPSYTYYDSQSSVTRSPMMASLPAGTRPPHLLPTPAGSSNPALIRTSTIQQSPTTPGIPVGTTQSFNPYAMYPANTKAQLKLDGELNTMVDSWTDEEWDMKRRLVQFRRSQAGSVITASFEGVSPEDRTPNSICVSCIYWAEKNECYVTSVDTIQLLESLVAVRFTVEEKNRIRRNLEGFRPATVSKTKPESEEFFKLIMGFPTPKPRNIEKDVKVFPWRILATALKKIIGKYASHHSLHELVYDANLYLQSASYSSTAGALHQPVASASGYARGSDTALDPLHYQSHRPIASPMSTTSASSHVYATSMTTQAYHGGSAGLGVGPSAGPPDLRLTVPGAGGHQTASSWQRPTSVSHYSTDLSGSASVAQGSQWDFGTYTMGASPATGLPSSAQSTAYQYNLGSSAQTQQQRLPLFSTSQAAHAMTEGRFLPLYGQEGGNNQQTPGI
jgi:hypothetical protein